MLKILYYSQIYSHLSYCISVWGNSQSETTSMQLQKLQNKVVKIIPGKNKIKLNDFHELRILHVKQIIRLGNLKFAYKIKESPPPIENNRKLLSRSHGQNIKEKSLV